MSIYSALGNIDPRMDSINSKQDEIINMLLSIDGNSLKYLKNPTKEQIEIAVRKNPSAIKYASGDEFDEKLMYELLDKPYDCDHIANAIADMGIREFEKENLLRYFINKNIKSNIEAIETLIPTFEKLEFDTQLCLWKYIIAKDNGNHSELIYTMYLHGDLRDEVIRFALEVSIDYLKSCESMYWTRELTEEFIKKYPHKVACAIVASHSEDKASELCRLALDNCTSHFDADSVIDCLKGFKEDNMKVFTELLESKNWHLIIDRFWVYFNMEPELADYVVNKFTIETLCDNCDSSALKMILNKLPFFKRHSYLKRMKKYLKEKENNNEHSGIQGR
jgi:hypothetical protein